MGHSEYNYYGSYSTLLNFLDYDFIYPSGDFSIQHGMKFASGWPKDYYENINKYFCWGEYEKKQRLIDFNGQIETIGAPFFYAKGLLDEAQIQNEKKRLGHNLLVFPSHSTHFNIASFDMEQFLSNLEKQKKKFDSIRICVYWKDVLNGLHEVYQNHGYECVCSGHIFDINFLQRQKSLIDICDCTYSNSLGSQVIYSVFSKKPYYLEPIDINYEFNHTTYTKKEYNSVLNNSEYKKIFNLFSKNTDYIINQEMLDVLEPHGGFKEIKNKEELRNLIFSL